MNKGRRDGEGRWTCVTQSQFEGPTVLLVIQSQAVRRRGGRKGKKQKIGKAEGKAAADEKKRGRSGDQKRDQKRAAKDY